MSGKSEPPDDFLSERLAALRSLDRTQILAYADRWGARLPWRQGPVFRASVHKARLSPDDLSEAERELSAEWLAAHGFRVGGVP